MPDGLLARVEAAIKAAGGTVNAFIVAAIEEKLQRRESGSTPEPRAVAPPKRSRKPRDDTAPAVEVHSPQPPSRAHAITCKCAVCKPSTGGT